MKSICPHCKGMFWEVETDEPRNSAFKVNFIRCAGCKAPIGVKDFFDTHSKLVEMEKSIKDLTGLLHQIDENVRRLSRG